VKLTVRLHFEEPKSVFTYTTLPPTCLNDVLINYEQGRQYRYCNSIAHGTRHSGPRQHCKLHTHAHTHKL